jgi:hypothetical protein
LEAAIDYAQSALSSMTLRADHGAFDLAIFVVAMRRGGIPVERRLPSRGSRLAAHAKSTACAKKPSLVAFDRLRIDLAAIFSRIASTTQPRSS